MWERIAALKVPVVEPRSAELFGATCEDYRAKLDAPGMRGAVFFAVMRWASCEARGLRSWAGWMCVCEAEKCSVMYGCLASKNNTRRINTSAPIPSCPAPRMQRQGERGPGF